MKLSVITPTFNRRDLLERVLHSLELQTWTDFEWVVAVDGSTDGTLVLLEVARKRTGFPLVVLALEQGGQARARNAAIQAATGEVLVFCDDDVIFEPDTLARHAAFHAVYPNDIAVGPVRNATTNQVDFPRVVTFMNFTGMNVSVSRQAVLDTGLFDESFSQYGGEDLDLGIRLERAGHKFRRLPDALATHLAPAARDARKGFLAGEAAARLAGKYGSNVGALLGVHPAILALKRVVMNPVGDAILGRNPNYAFERAYLKGARAARNEAAEPAENLEHDAPETPKGPT